MKKKNIFMSDDYGPWFFALGIIVIGFTLFCLYWAFFAHLMEAYGV